MNIISIDTSTECLGLCLKTEESLFKICARSGFNHHQETLAPWIAGLCREARINPAAINLVVVATGPGSFTGLRIGISLAKGLADGAQCDIVGVPILDAQAWGFRELDQTIAPVIDGRKGRIYSAVYRKKERISDYLDLCPDDLLDLLLRYASTGTLFLTGPYAGQLSIAFSGKVSQNIDWTIDPDHATFNPYFLLQKGEDIYMRSGGSIENLRPFYLRKSEAEIKINQNHKHE